MRVGSGNPRAAAAQPPANPEPAPPPASSDPGEEQVSVANRGTPGSGFVDNVEGDIAPPTNEPSCGGAVFEPERLPLDMYFLVDSSGSMAEPTQNGPSKWELVSQALIDFLGDPANAPLGMGVGFFPAFPAAAAPACTVIPIINVCVPAAGGTAGPDLGSCVPGDYASPSVPLTLQPAPAQLIDSIQQRALAGTTPTSAALQGTYQYLDTWTTQNPGRKVVTVLATDGEPTPCDPLANTPADVANLAAAALAGPSQIQTFVIGVGQSLANLNQVALAGGTSRAYLTDTNSDLADELAAVLESIRTSAGPCAFEIPDSTSEGAVDPNLVNVRFTPSGATEPTVVPKTFDGAAEGCGPMGGWYYDDPAAPTSIQLCEASCAAAFNARMEVEFGCEAIVLEPR